MDTSSEYVSLGDISRSRLGKQAQYGTRFFSKTYCKNSGYTYLGYGLRIVGGEDGNYHEMKIHKDDVEEAVRRYETHQKRRQS